MSKPRIYFTPWVEPYLKRARKAQVKVSNKNLAKLRDAWIGWCINEYATNGTSKLDVLFWCTYGEIINTLVPDMLSSNSLFEMVSKIYQDGSLGSTYHQPVVLGLEHCVVWNTDD